MSLEVTSHVIVAFYHVIVAFAEISLVGTAFLITTRREIHQVIGAYRWQSLLLALADSFIIISKRYENLSGASLALAGTSATQLLSVILPLSIVALPLSLGFTIHRILAGATVHEPVSIRWILTGTGAYEPNQKNSVIINQAKAVWLKSRYDASGKTGLSFFGLLVLAFAIVFFGINIDVDKRLGIAVSLLLHLTGLYNAKARKDVIAQMIGILTMDQGMLLAIVKIVDFPFPADLFVLAVYFYTVITLLLLFFIVPSLHRLHKTIDLDEIAVKSDLRG